MLLGDQPIPIRPYSRDPHQVDFAQQNFHTGATALSGAIHTTQVAGLHRLRQAAHREGGRVSRLSGTPWRSFTIRHTVLFTSWHQNYHTEATRCPTYIPLQAKTCIVVD